MPDQAKPPTAAQLRRQGHIAAKEMKVAREVAAKQGYHGCLGVYTTPEAFEVATAGHSLLDLLFDREAG